ncbi:MAG: hypothetical protein C5B51_28290 [Terriglobia bacterium]|nr:MAG: hypothetical protein C5B51_28290 [Terriglobia bacterium]
MFSATAKFTARIFFFTSVVSCVCLAQGLTVTSSSQLLPGLVGIPYSFTFTASGGTPPYAWSPLTTLPLGLSLSSAGVLSGTPATNAQSIFSVRLMDSAGTVTSQQVTLQIGTAASPARTGVLSQIAAGAAWDTTIYLVSTSSALNGGSITFRDDTGTPLTLALTTQQQGIIQGVSASVVTFVLNPNTTMVLHTSAPPNAALQQGWADVRTTGGIGAFAIFKQTLPSGVIAEGTSGQQGQFSSSIVIPFDNTPGSVTTAALVSLSNVPLTVTATIWDENGNQLGTQVLNLAILAHMAFAIPTQFPATAGKRGEVRFDNGTNSDAITALGLSFSSLTGNSFTSVPGLVP